MNRRMPKLNTIKTLLVCGYLVKNFTFPNL